MPLPHSFSIFSVPLLASASFYPIWEAVLTFNQVLGTHEHTKLASIPRPTPRVDDQGHVPIKQPIQERNKGDGVQAK